jgi:hypothetical protein
MWAIRTSGLMSGDGKRGDASASVLAPSTLQVPADAQNNHLAREMTAFEGIERG